MAFPIPPSLQKSLEETKVEYMRLGNSGLQVSWPILGALGFGQSSVVPWLLSEEKAFEVLKAAYDCGINTWDTANAYSNGLSEEILGRFIKKYDIPRYKVVLMTKCAFHVGEESDVLGAAFQTEVNQSKDYINQGGTAILTKSIIVRRVS
jgi:aryl-alcohol dehydrogenase-like predicted oxidoreductase